MIFISDIAKEKAGLWSEKRRCCAQQLRAEKDQRGGGGGDGLIGGVQNICWHLRGWLMIKCWLLFVKHPTIVRLHNWQFPPLTRTNLRTSAQASRQVFNSGEGRPIHWGKKKISDSSWNSIHCQVFATILCNVKVCSHQTSIEILLIRKRIFQYKTTGVWLPSKSRIHERLLTGSEL